MMFERKPLPVEGVIPRLLRHLAPLLDWETGPWIAGGCLRRMLDGQMDFDGFDIDVFAPNIEKAAAFRQAMPKFLPAEKSRSLKFDLKTSASTATRNSERMGVFEGHAIKVQVIGSHYFETIKDLVRDFDFTACMAATDGVDMLIDQRMEEDVANRRLRLNNGKPRDQSLLRLGRYAAQGFVPDPGVIATMLDIGGLKLTKDMTVSHARAY